MGEDPGTAGAPVTEAKDPEQIRDEIEATRRELGDTVEALACQGRRQGAGARQDRDDQGVGRSEEG